MSVNGRVIPHTPLAVDFWQVRKCPGARLFFLSHMHSDHTVGLTSTWTGRPIFCSPVTATLLKLKLQVKEQWIHPLELGEPYTLPLDDVGKEMLTVTLMDANHCPGAVMFLFQAYFGCILYTGDFRYSPSMLRDQCLRTNATIDVLYLDDTNCDPNRCLPSRQCATQQIKEIIRRHPNHHVVIGVYALGKESLLLELAMEFKTWVEVTVSRMETLRALELPDVFSTEPGAGSIRAVDMSQISSTNLLEWNKVQPTLAILPTSRPLVSFHPDVYVVPYSDHSSYQELEDFVSALKPTTLVPIVGNCVPGSLTALLPSKRRHEFLVPESVHKYMRHSEVQPSLPNHADFHHSCLRALHPKGVIFESPLKVHRRLSVDTWESEDLEDADTADDMDRDGSQNSDCILMDLSKSPVPRRVPGGDFCLNIANTISEEEAVQEKFPLSQFTQSNFGPVQVLTNYNASLKPMGATRGHMASDTELGMDTESEESACSPQTGRGAVQHEDTAHVSWHTEQKAGLDGSDGHSHVWSEDMSVLRQEDVDELDDRILLQLTFTKEDFQKGKLLDPQLLHRFPLCPINEKFVLSRGNDNTDC